MHFHYEDQRFSLRVHNVYTIKRAHTQTVCVRHNELMNKKRAQSLAKSEYNSLIDLGSISLEIHYVFQYEKLLLSQQ